MMHELAELGRQNTKDDEPSHFFQACTRASLNPGKKK